MKRVETNVDFVIHPMAKLFPDPSQDEYGSLTQSIKEKGLQTPVLLWKNAKGENNLIDGRTRAKIIRDLLADGTAKAADGSQIALRFQYFEGTEAEALDYIISINVTRRALSSSQRAASAVRCGAMAYKLRQKEAGVDPDKIEMPSGADLVDTVAGVMCTNRTYMYDCANLEGKYPDLIDRVLTGELRISKAKRIAANRDANQPDEPGGKVPEVKVEEKETVYDSLKNPVPENLREVFEGTYALIELKKRISSCAEEFKKLADLPHGKNINVALARTDLKNAIVQIESHMPYCVCPECKGDEEGQRCGVCGGLGWIDLVLYKQLDK